VGEAALMATVRQLKAKGKNVILITHRPGAIAAADQLVMLQDGEIKASGPRDAVLAALRSAQSAASASAAVATPAAAAT